MSLKCNDCGDINTATMDDGSKFCLGCGTQLTKSIANTNHEYQQSKSSPMKQKILNNTNNPPPAVVTDEMVNKLALHIQSAMAGKEEIQTDSNSSSRVQSPSLKPPRINDINHNFQDGKYLYIKFSDPLHPDVCREIINVIYVEREDGSEYKQVQLEDGSEYKFYPEQNERYQFIQILDEPYWNKSKLSFGLKVFSNWNLMEFRQKILILMIVSFMIIIDMMYAIGWTLDELTQLTTIGEETEETIYCGKDSVYDRITDDRIYYESICIYDDTQCDMKRYGEILMDGVIMSVLLNCLIWVSLLVIIFYDRHFLKNVCNKITIFIGYVMSGILLGIACILWGSVDSAPPKCLNGCEFMFGNGQENDGMVECEYVNGHSYNLYFSISIMSLIFGLFLSFYLKYV